MLRTIGAGAGVAGISGLGGCLDDGDVGTTTPETREELVEVRNLIPEDGLFIVPFQRGLEENTWVEHGIDLKLRITTYAEYSRGFETGGLRIGTTDQSMFVDGHQRDIDLVAFGSNLLQINDIFVRPDSDIESPADLEGRKVGVPFWESATTLGMRAFIKDRWGFSLREDTEGTSAPPPVLWELLTNQKEIDAAVQFTGFTIKGYANPDVVRPIFNISNHWKEETGHPLSVTYFTARRDFFDNNPNIAYRLIQGWKGAIDAVAASPEDSYQRFGLLAGLESEAEAKVATERFEAGEAHLRDPVEWTDEYLDAQWEFLNLLEKTGLKESTPPRDSLLSFSEVEERGA